MNKNNEVITSYKLALELMNRFILISKPYGELPSLYTKSSDGDILVLNKNTKYYISKEKFIEDFPLLKFYIYKDLSDIEIDQEFRKLRQ